MPRRQISSDDKPTNQLGSSFLFLRPGSSNFGGDGQSSAATTADSGVSDYPFSSHATYGETSHLPTTTNSHGHSNLQGPSASSSHTRPPLRVAPHRPRGPEPSYPPAPPPTNASLSPNPYHARSLTTVSASSNENTAGSSSQNQQSSPRAHPYQLAAYDSYTYRAAEPQPTLPTPKRPDSTTFVRPAPPARVILSPPATHTASESQVPTSQSPPHEMYFESPRFEAHPYRSYYEEKRRGRPSSPTTPGTPADATHGLLVPTRLSERKQTSSERRRKQLRRQSLATLQSLRILNTYAAPQQANGHNDGGATPAAAATPARLSVSDPRSAAISALIIGGLLVLPIVLSVAYICVGHAVLRAVQGGPASVYGAVRVSASARTAAVGAAILAVPIVLVIYLLGVYPAEDAARSSDANAEGEEEERPDFFDDESDESDAVCGPKRLMLYARVAFCLVMWITIGGLAGMLGVTVLSESGNDGAASARRTVYDGYLPVGATAAAGFVGGGIVFTGLLVFLSIWIGTMLCTAIKPPAGE